MSAAYYPMKQFASISSAANKPKLVPLTVTSPLISRTRGGK
jgi:hypothetical protein